MKKTRQWMTVFLERRPLPCSPVRSARKRFSLRSQMRPNAISTDETTGSSRFQTDSEMQRRLFARHQLWRSTRLPCSDDYERQDGRQAEARTNGLKFVWPTADVHAYRASDTALALEAHRRRAYRCWFREAEEYT